jgi:hypothetical protein
LCRGATRRSREAHPMSRKGGETWAPPRRTRLRRWRADCHHQDVRIVNPRSTDCSTRRRPSFLDLVARIFGLFALSDNSKKVLAQTDSSGRFDSSRPELRFQGYRFHDVAPFRDQDRLSRWAGRLPLRSQALDPFLNHRCGIGAPGQTVSHREYLGQVSPPYRNI